MEKYLSIQIIKPLFFTTSQRQHSGQEEMCSCQSLHLIFMAH